MSKTWKPGKIKITVEAPPNGFKSTMAEFLRNAMFDAFDAAVVFDPSPADSSDRTEPPPTTDPTTDAYDRRP